MTTVGVYRGTISDSTTQLFKKQPWEKYLSGFKTQAFGSSTLPSSKEGYYEQIDTEPRIADSAMKKIWAAFIDTMTYIRHHDPDIILQIMRFPTHAPGVSTAAALNDVPVITRYMGDNFSEYKHHQGLKKIGMYFFGNWVARIPLRLSNKIIALGPKMRDKLVENGVDPSNIIIVPPLVDMPDKFNTGYDKTRYKRKVGLSDEQTVILYTGRLEKLKGMEFLKEVIKETSTTERILYLLVGDGSYEEQFNEEFERDRVLSVGRVPYEEIHKYYKAADVYLHPSPFEGIPLSIIEALQCGVPVIARDAGDIEFVTPNIATTVEEMVTMIQNEDWSAEWKNQDYFDIENGKHKIEQAIQSSIQLNDAA
jgi:glycosyltransferase involved in cell wall biosynthesis